MRRGSSAFSLILCVSVASAAADDDGKTLMGAATRGLVHLTMPHGRYTMVSGTLAKSASGQIFKKLARCVYGLEEGSGRDVHVEIVDFSGLTGAVSYGGVVSKDVIFAGRKPTTRCFVVAGERGCQYDLDLWHVPPQEVGRVIDDVAYILRAGCGAGPKP